MNIWLSRSIILMLGLAIWFTPVPEGLSPQAWRLFAIFITTISAIIVSVLPVFTASILALAAAVLTGTVAPEDAYAGFSEGFILLIIVAFLIARGVVKSGLGTRIAYLLIRRFGSSTLRLGYCLVATDAIIAPGFPSNTARSGILFPIVYALAIGSDSKVDDGTRKKMGSYLMMNSMAGLTISSALWLTAMAANPAGAAIARDMGIEITFVSWFIASSVPSLAALVIVPFLLYVFFAPELKKTPEAPTLAAQELKKMGPISRQEWIMASTFLVMIVCWGLSDLFAIDKTAIAFLGLAVVMLADIFTIDDLKNEGDALETFIWFSILYTLSTALNRLGFMGFLGEIMAAWVEGLSWPVIYVALVSIYVFIHYLFVSQTAQMLALYGVFLGVAIDAGVPPMLIALMLLFATNFFAVITPQGSSANVIFAGSGYLSQAEMYRNGLLVTLANLSIYLTIGSAWILFLGN